MKNFRTLTVALLFVMPLFMGTGCQMLGDLWPFGGDPSEKEGIDVPLPEQDPLLPGGFEEGPVEDRVGEWTPRPELKLPTIYFSYDKFTIGAREKKILDQVADYMQKSPALGIIVEGHCDERGSDEYNRSLGERRALAVHDYLITIGIPSDRVQTQSFGEERPAITGTEESAFSKNRRAELILADM